MRGKPTRVEQVTSTTLSSLKPARLFKILLVCRWSFPLDRCGVGRCGQLGCIGHFRLAISCKELVEDGLAVALSHQATSHQSHPSNTMPHLHTHMVPAPCWCRGGGRVGGNLVALGCSMCAACWRLRASTHAWRCGNTILVLQSVHHPISIRNKNQEHMRNIQNELDSVWCVVFATIWGVLTS